jgi:transposase InsO family protein
MMLVKPATVVQWHRQGFTLYWRWRSRSGRPSVSREIRDLIRQMSRANPLWGAPRIHGELLKLGIEISQATVAKYMPKRSGSSSPTWRTFLRNEAMGIAAIDMFVVPSAAFRLLFVVLILVHNRRKVVHFNVTSNPTSAWLSRQVTEAFPWDTAPRFLLRDRDSSYGSAFSTRVAAMRIAEVKTAPHSPWQNGYVERVIGSIRRECLDYVIVFNERHLRRVLKSYLEYYNRTRTHLSLEKDCPNTRSVQPPERGKVIALRCHKSAACTTATNASPPNQSATSPRHRLVYWNRCRRSAKVMDFGVSYMSGEHGVSASSTASARRSMRPLSSIAALARKAKSFSEPRMRRLAVFPSAIWSAC